MITFILKQLLEFGLILLGFFVAIYVIIMGFGSIILLFKWLFSIPGNRRDKKLHLSFFLSRMNEIQSVPTVIKSSLSNNNQYITHKAWSGIIAVHKPLHDEIKDKEFEKIGLSPQAQDSISYLKSLFSIPEKAQRKFNEEYIKNELKIQSFFFDSILKFPLNPQQRRAIVTDEDNNLVIAGAGSGKTTTIVGKVNYLVSKQGVKPEEILLISFTRKSAQSLSEKIKIDGITVNTFHKFGKDVILDVEGKPSIFSEAQFNPFIKKTFNDLMHTEKYLKAVTSYFINDLKPYRSQFDFADQGEYIQYLKDQNFRAYKQVNLTKDGKMTLRMEIVKSIEECKIANFLFFNNVSYEYESPYEYSQASQDYRQYKPDFTILHDGRKIYLEHFGIARNGNVPSWFTGDDRRSATQKYQDEMVWKRNTHKNYATKLIESYSYEMNEGILFENLSRHLNEAGVVLTPKSPDEIWQTIREAANDEVDSIINLFSTFITLIKSNNYTLADVVLRNEKLKETSAKYRNSKFIELITPIYKKYQEHLSAKNEIDFSDMINKATTYITSGQYQKKFSYILVDEFQDISIGRYNLLKAIRDQNPDSKLFCVGDDWQSIYRFTGSDIALFKEFEKYFGFTEKSKIETTHRFFDPLIKLSSEFILKNPNQVPKDLKSNSKGQSTDFKIVYSKTDNQDITQVVNEIFDELISSKSELHKKSIFLLGRYSFDIEKLSGNHNLKILVRDFEINSLTKEKTVKKEYEYFPAKWKSLEKEEKIFIQYNKTVNETQYRLEAEFLTVHKAKGMEAEIVLVINCNSGKHGFPSEMSDDPILNLLLTEADQFENGEERRLFYVAMTRAKENVYFIADCLYKSKFISEIEIKSSHNHVLKCPVCKSSDLILKKSGISKKNDKYHFYGCTNYLYGCDYTETKWEKTHKLYSKPNSIVIEEADEF